MSPRAKGQPVFPKKVLFCLECIAVGFHRAGCPIAKVVKRTVKHVPPPRVTEEADE